MSHNKNLNVFRETAPEEPVCTQEEIYCKELVHKIVEAWGAHNLIWEASRLETQGTVAIVVQGHHDGKIPPCPREG